MKKLITLLIVFLSVGITVKSANTYLIYSATGGTWTNTTGITNPVPVNLSTVNGGSAVSLNAWYADRKLVAPTMGGGFQFDTGDQVWIISGTYLLTDTLKLYAGVSMYGGFSGAESTISARIKGTNAWDFTNETILDGNATTVGIAGGSATIAAIIDGLTISNCKNSTAAFSGAGASLNGALTTMQNCIIKNCITESTSATSSGGVVQTGGSTVKDCYIHDNKTSGYGGGVTVTGDDCKLTGCRITDNTAALFGGGVNLYSTTSGVTVSNCIISNNITSTKSGGGLLVFSTGVTNANPITISNCTFTSNRAPGASGSGGALYLNTKVGNIVNVSNNSFTSNSAYATKSTTNGGGAIWLAAGTHNIDKCTFTNDSVKVSNGGAILVASASATATISNSVFTGNISPNHGAALMLTYSGTVYNCLLYGNKGGNAAYVGTSIKGIMGVFNNCTVASNYNAAGTANVGIYLSTPKVKNAAFTNCLFYNSGAKPVGVDPLRVDTVAALPDVTYSGFDQDLSTTWTESSNKFTISSSSFFDAANNNFHLVTGSIAIDAGVANYDYTVDLDGFTRDANYDLGAYEYNPNYVPNAVSKVDNSFDCYAYGSNVIIKGLEYGKVVNIYSITGVRMFSQKISAGALTVALPAGIYIVNVASSNKKVIVR